MVSFLSPISCCHSDFFRSLETVPKVLTTISILSPSFSTEYYFTWRVFYTNSWWLLTRVWVTEVSRTLLSILADLNNAVVWLVSTRPFISNSSNPCTNHLGTIPKVPTTISITITFIFHRLLLFTAMCLTLLTWYNFCKYFLSEGKKCTLYFEKYTD